jgi:hypothetical protein
MSHSNYLGFPGVFEEVSDILAKSRPDDAILQVQLLSIAHLIRAFNFAHIVCYDHDRRDCRSVENWMSESRKFFSELLDKTTDAESKATFVHTQRALLVYMKSLDLALKAGHIKYVPEFDKDTSKSEFFKRHGALIEALVESSAGKEIGGESVAGLVTAYWMACSFAANTVNVAAQNKATFLFHVGRIEARLAPI